jgi:outer membrane biosynthesis protein TonB
MNSTNGTIVNGSRVVTAKIELGQSFILADQKFDLQNAVSEAPPPILEMLAPPPPTIEKPKLPREKDHRQKSMEGEYPKIVQYPLAADPKALYSEYIFEDVESLHPIFRYEHDFNAVEVVILFRDKIISADYLPMRNASYFIVGHGDQKNTLEFAYLPKHDRQLFVDIKSSAATVYSLEGFKQSFISDTDHKSFGGKPAIGNAPINLAKDDILCFNKGELSIFVRQTEAPPKVKSAPLFSSDPELRKYLFLFMLVTVFSCVVIAFYPIEKDKEKEKEMEKAPDRVVRILQKKPAVSKAIAKTEDKPKEIIQRSPVVKEVINQDAEQKAGNPNAPDAPARKASPRQGPVEKKLDVVTPKVGNPSGKRLQTAPTPTVSRGPVDTFKAIDFSSSLSRVLSKGGQTSMVKNVDNTQTSVEVGSGTVVGGGESATVTKATVPERVGSMSGVASGQLDATRGLEGVVSKRGVVTAGIPDQIVVLGGMDPDTIDKILRDHLPQFRYCYQKVLDRSSNEFEGRFTINFVIGASGNVTRAAITKSNLPDNVSACVENVVRGIQFPEPRGGGLVEVNKPLNFVVKNN